MVKKSSNFQKNWLIKYNAAKLNKNKRTCVFWYQFKRMSEKIFLCIQCCTKKNNVLSVKTQKLFNNPSKPNKIKNLKKKYII